MSDPNTKIPLATQELKMDEEGFVTPGKAISLPGLSLGIWVATLIIYRVLVAIDLCPKYTAFCFFTSLALSVMGSWFTVNKMKTNVTTSSKFFLILMNTFVIYTSANGIQAGNSFLSTSTPGEICQKASLIPFLAAAPWLPDKTSRETIEAQSENLNKLRDSMNSLKLRYDELISAQETSEGSVITLINRADSLQKLLQLAEQKNLLWDALKNRWANASDRSMDTLIYNFQRRDRGLPRTSKGFVSFLADSTAGARFYKELFEQ